MSTSKQNAKKSTPAKTGKVLQDVTKPAPETKPVPIVPELAKVGFGAQRASVLALEAMRPLTQMERGTEAFDAALAEARSTVCGGYMAAAEFPAATELTWEMYQTGRALLVARNAKVLPENVKPGEIKRTEEQESTYTSARSVWMRAAQKLGLVIKTGSGGARKRAEEPTVTEPAPETKPEPETKPAPIGKVSSVDELRSRAHELATSVKAMRAPAKALCDATQLALYLDALAAWNKFELALTPKAK